MTIRFFERREKGGILRKIQIYLKLQLAFEVFIGFYNICHGSLNFVQMHLKN